MSLNKDDIILIEGANKRENNEIDQVNKRLKVMQNIYLKYEIQNKDVLRTITMNGVNIV